MLSAEQLAGMQSVAASALPATCSIQRNTPAGDSAGGQADSWSTVATVACRVSTTGSRSPDEREIAARLQAVNPYTVRVPAGTDVREADRIVVGTRTFQVIGVINTTWEAVRRAVCVEVL